MVSGPELRSAPYTTWNDTTISGEFFKDQINLTYGTQKRYTLYMRNVTNTSFVTTNLTFNTRDVKIDNVYFNNTQYSTLTAIINNASVTGFANVNVTNTTWLSSADANGIALFDALFRYNNATHKNPANITVEATSFWNGNYSTANSGNFYFRDNSNGDVLPFYIPPNAYFTQNLTSGVAPFTLTITDQSEWDEGATYWNMSFGDGTVSFINNDTYKHAYTIPGTYTTNLTIVNPAGRSSYLGNITVYLTAPPTLYANFTASPLEAAINENVTFTDTSTDTPISWLWGFGDGTNSSEQNPVHAYSSTGLKSVVLTVSNATASNSITYPNYINVSTSGVGGFNQQDIELTPSYFLLLNVVDSSGVAIAGATVTTSDGQTNTTIVGKTTTWHPYSIVTVCAGASGYDGQCAQYTMDQNREETIQLEAATPTTTTTWYSPHQVRFTVLNSYGNNMAGVSLNATANITSMPADYLTDLYGITPDIANEMVNNTLIMAATTGGDGAATFTMHSSISYDMRMTNPVTGSSYFQTVWPKDDQYILRMQTSSVIPDPGTNVYNAVKNTSLTFTEPNNSYVTMGLQYQDTLARTTNLTFYVFFDNNKTIVYARTFGNPGTAVILANYTTKNIRGTRYIWNYTAVRT